MWNTEVFWALFGTVFGTVWPVLALFGPVYTSVFTEFSTCFTDFRTYFTEFSTCFTDFRTCFTEIWDPGTTCVLYPSGTLNVPSFLIDTRLLRMSEE